ncbi:MAG: hypothetical protein ABI797_00990 [Chloroflexota bacterium]
MDENETQTTGEGTERPRAGSEMLIQLQQMIDTLATQAAPVMREVAAKAAELAAVAGEKAGPLAHKAAGITETMGQRISARSKEMAADLRRPKEAGADDADGSDAGDSGAEAATDAISEGEAERV